MPFGAFIRRGLPVLLLAAPLLGIATRAEASEKSEVLISRGLLDFHAANYQAAYASFDEAVRADPVNVEALYYRAMTRARLGDLDAAIFDLMVALDLKPDFYEAALQIGAARMQQGDDRDALRWLERARESPALEADASLLLGVARLHLGDTEAAAIDLERAGRTEDTRVTADYYRGVASYRLWRWNEATQQFSYVRDARPEGETGVQAAGFLRQLQPYHLNVGVEIDYDTNVVLAPSNDVVKSDVGVTNQADGRVAFTVGGTVVPWRTGHFQLVLGYEFFQTLQFQLSQFNLQGNQPSAQLLFNAGPVQGGVLGTYGYYLLQAQSFMEQAVAAPWISIPESDVGRTELFYRMLFQNFYLTPFRGVRDSINNGVGFQQFFYLGREQRYLTLGYRYERQNALETIGDAFAYDGNEFQAAIGWDLTPTLDGLLSYAYRIENYDAASNGRRDLTNHLVLNVRKALSDWLWLSGFYLGTWNNSNQAVFTYDRNIVSLAVEVRL